MLDLRWVWAKSGNDPACPLHPLMCHLVDTAMVSAALWDRVLPQPVRERIGLPLGLPAQQVRGVVFFLVAAHDIGKATPPFQALLPIAKEHLACQGLRFLPAARIPHGWCTARIMVDYLTSADAALRVPLSWARQLACCVAGHHGTFPRTDELRTICEAALGGEPWQRARQEILKYLAGLLELRAVTLEPMSLPPPQANAALMLLAGLTSVADWIASCEALFPYAGPEVDLQGYLKGCAARASRALDQLGWLSQPATTAHASFQELFRLAPRPLQQTAEAMATTSRPSLAVIEAPMGEGKTEAAFYLADQWAACLDHRGFYVGLPTQATSNQMFGRLRDFLAGRHPAERINLQLQHSHAALQADFQTLRLAGVAQDQMDEGRGAVVAEEWFTPRKRGLLAPFGVGSVDQALLAVLQTRHVFVRLLGLSGKTVIVDEVHAYDAYMSTILDRLLEWLSALGCSVVLLSATLPRQRRVDLLATYSHSTQLSGDGAYPRITTWDGQEVKVWSFPAARSSTVTLQRTQGNLADWLPRMLSGGGCAAVICNTVARAQAVYASLKPALEATGIGLGLFHARFPFGQRLAIEQQVIARYGRAPGGSRNAVRPAKAVLVATQVIEQSLDLDFDVMVSEMAPIDLLLQRAGRLHRHAANDPRPEPLRQPTMWLLEPPNDARGLPAFGPTEYVYDRHVLLRTYLALQGRAMLQLPEDIDRLVNTVYQEQFPPPAEANWQQALAQSREESEARREASQLHAARFVIGPPRQPDGLLEDFCQELEEDNPDVARNLQASTREGDPAIQCVCLYQVRGQLCLDPAGALPVDLAKAPDLPQTQRFLEAAVPVTHHGLFQELRPQAVPPAWRRNALLRHCRSVVFSATGAATLGRWQARLDPELGLSILSDPTAGGIAP